MWRWLSPASLTDGFLQIWPVCVILISPQDQTKSRYAYQLLKVISLVIMRLLVLSITLEKYAVRAFSVTCCNKSPFFMFLKLQFSLFGSPYSDFMVQNFSYLLVWLEIKSAFLFHIFFATWGYFLGEKTNDKFTPPNTFLWTGRFGYFLKWQKVKTITHE